MHEMEENLSCYGETSLTNTQNKIISKIEEIGKQLKLSLVVKQTEFINITDNKIDTGVVFHQNGKKFNDKHHRYAYNISKSWDKSKATLPMKKQKQQQEQLIYNTAIDMLMSESSNLSSELCMTNSAALSIGRKAKI